jgi:1-aminocyclopropane-1-carboxylate deaminase/D-cysteine desulfhydrase-like pyridoxal-dependent ACC family enzyme
VEKFYLGETTNMFEQFKKHINEDAAVLQKVVLPNTNNNVNVYLKREDLLHPIISGNKWRKLKYNLVEAKEKKHKTILTFGGAFSNHIHATAGAGKIFGFNTIGVIRGEEHLPLNPTLKDATEFGMKIHYVSRSDYRKKTEREFIKMLHQKFGDFYLVPEGGTNNLAVKGGTEIVQDINIDFDYIVSACGTGGTLAGVICGLEENKKAIGISALKGAGFLKEKITEYVKEYSGKAYNNWQIKLDYHFGGFAKTKPEQITYMKEFEKLNNILLDPIYTSKMIYGIYDMIIKGEIENGSTVIALHTGGLQGRRGKENILNEINQ